MNRNYINIWLGCILLMITSSLKAQQVGINTNILYWATTTPNIGIETALSKKVTIDIQGTYNPWRFGSREENKKIKHWVIQPEVRLWNCEKFNGSFWGIHSFYGKYNMGGIELPLGILPGMKNHRYEGYFAGGGISYDYQWYLGKRWNLHATIGVGYAYAGYKKYECRLCGDYIGKENRHYVGPTKLGLSLIYLL